jgi:hypothetical protein
MLEAGLLMVVVCAAASTINRLRRNPRDLWVGVISWHILVVSLYVGFFLSMKFHLLPPRASFLVMLVLMLVLALTYRVVVPKTRR